MTRLLLTLATLAMAASTNAKDVLYPDPGLSVLNDAFIAAIGPGAARTVSPFTEGQLPRNCAEQASTRCGTAAMEAFSVSFSDCDMSWAVCRCPDAPVSLDQLLDSFGRLPPNLRAHVRTVIALPDTSNSAYSNANDIVLLGDVPAFSVMLHEAAHTLDKGRSGEQEFLSVLDQDSCWADDYAKGNGEGDGATKPEVWAQNLVLRRYEVSVGPLDRDASCMANQLRVAAQQTDAQLASATCDGFKETPDEVVPRRRRRAARGEHVVRSTPAGSTQGYPNPINFD